MEERLQKILSSCGVASRRHAEKMINDGLVAVNGKKATLGMCADIGRDEITVNGSPVEKKTEKIYIMLNKPRGYVTTMQDEKGRRTVSDLVAELGVRVYPVGRLDMDSEGLLIMTNDGELTNSLLHPSGEKEKVYRVKISGDISRLPELEKPMDIDGYMIKPARVRLIHQGEKTTSISITIHEGRNRQIRKMCDKCGFQVLRLKRIKFAGLELRELKTGCWRYLTDSEIKKLCMK